MPIGIPGHTFSISNNKVNQDGNKRGKRKGKEVRYEAGNTIILIYLVNLLHPSYNLSMEHNGYDPFFQPCKGRVLPNERMPQKFQGTLFCLRALPTELSRTFAHEMDSNHRPRRYQRITITLLSVPLHINVLFLPYAPTIIKTFLIFAMLRSI